MLHFFFFVFVFVFVYACHNHPTSWLPQSWEPCNSEITSSPIEAEQPKIPERCSHQCLIFSSPVANNIFLCITFPKKVMYNATFPEHIIGTFHVQVSLMPQTWLSVDWTCSRVNLFIIRSLWWFSLALFHSAPRFHSHNLYPASACDFQAQRPRFVRVNHSEKVHETGFSRD